MQKESAHHPNVHHTFCSCSSLAPSSSYKSPWSMLRAMVASGRGSRPSHVRKKEGRSAKAAKEGGGEGGWGKSSDVESSVVVALAATMEEAILGSC